MSSPSSVALDARELEALDRSGYVVVAAALDVPALERLRRAFGPGADARSGTEHVELGPSTPEREAWNALSSHPIVHAAARHLFGGAPFRERSLHGRNPLPGYGQQGLHTDWPTRASADEVRVVTLLWMLDDFSVENGATRVVPGSHRIVEPLSKPLAQPQAQHPREVRVTGAAGSVIVMNGHLWHSGTLNRSRGPRRAAQHVLVRAGEGATSDAGGFD
jgi:ectoine hydroxylase-related dioxygenase (phytanoyl-CoA dioxygenase family)